MSNSNGELLKTEDMQLEPGEIRLSLKQEINCAISPHLKTAPHCEIWLHDNEWSLKFTKSHGIGPTASRWNRSHSKIDVGIGPKFFLLKVDLVPHFGTYSTRTFQGVEKVPE